MGISRLDVIMYLSHGTDNPESEQPISHKTNSQNESSESGEKKYLEQFTVNLNKRAENGKLDPVIGREKEIERAIRILARRKKNNPIFVGDAGVGKTAVVEGLAQKLVGNLIPESLKGSVIYSLDIASLLAGTRYRGDFEERFKKIIKIIQNIEKAILFIDEIHTIIGAGATNSGFMDASNILKPALTSGDIKCIGATTFEEYRKHFIASKAFARRFQKVDIKEPPVNEAIEILKGLKKKYEDFYQITITDDAIETAVKLSVRFLHDKHLPDKAIDIIDEAGAANSLLNSKKKKEIISSIEIENIISDMAGIPPSKVTNSDKILLQNMEENLKLLIYGQEKAISIVSNAIKLSRSGIAEKHKPVGSFIFSGPTGVGKTELAKQLAFNLEIEFIRFDMSEYMEAHTVSRLIGAPPGYVGFDQGGLLTEAVSKSPHSVVLLDEIEKAHPDILNILLQIMDNGILTDHNGKKTDFQNIVLIMTTNLGARDMEKGTIGFAEESIKSDPDKAIKKHFSPEFRNRLDCIVNFNKLEKPVLIKVISKFLSELETQLSEKKVIINFTDEIKEWILEHGFDKKLGARPLSRFIQNKIKKNIVDEILFGKLEKGGIINISLKNDKINFEYKKQLKKKIKEKI